MELKNIRKKNIIEKNMLKYFWDSNENKQLTTGLELLYAPTLVGNSMLKYVWQHFWKSQKF